MLKDFIGIHYRLANHWFNILNVDHYKNVPINYLEIGAFYGGNLISVANTYASHNNSMLYCIDPWADYNDYIEYKGQQSKIYNTFLQNIENSGHKDKIIINRGYSHSMLHNFKDDFFDIIYIDGNHEPDYVLQDAVLSFKKLKHGGVLIFDDYTFSGDGINSTKTGIDLFISEYSQKIEKLGYEEPQMFIKKN